MKKTFFIMCIAFLALLLAFNYSPSLAQEKDTEEKGTVAAESEEAGKQPGGEVEEKTEKPEGAEAEAKEAEDEEKAAMKEEIKKLKEKVETLEQEGGKIILLMEGKIRYTVDPGAVMDYEEIVILMESGDADFKASMQKGGKEADTALIGILKRMSPDDRRITAEETKAFLKSMLEAPAKQKAAPAEKTEEPEKPAVVEKEEAPPQKTGEAGQPPDEKDEKSPAPEKK
jgi:hypothetical protein